ncbi:GNAT family acetyltransferase [Paenibacillus yonginensis]|uniref:GNAT family acetyltransferase n=1 Tax=Paenibacillus yonginensis TaxID=1462996 RepID=A0A1B1N3B5_9BACL|nr:GNAT family N-acetyltransferase [Paenibacillus yonginensis]ANS75931.1 GNAT family acetyltransferase [Paenibacillus yonginensis]
MEWNLKSFDQLTGTEVYKILQLRMNVFMLEQNCLYPEVDDKDQASHHLFLAADGEIAAYCRILPRGVSYPQASIGRVLVNPSYRRRGLAQELMRIALEFLKEEWHETEVKIQAQHYLESFYGTFGFRPVSDVYPEDGIPHVDMVLTVGEQLKPDPH